MIRSVVHISLLLHHLFVDYILLTTRNEDEANEAYNMLKNYSYAYLTFWNFFIQTVYLIVVSIIDINRVRLIKLPGPLIGQLHKMQALLFSALLAPFAILIPVIFWFIYLIDRELIYPKTLDAIIPFFVNISVHALIFLPYISEVILGLNRLCRKRYSLMLLWSFMVAYLITITATKRIYGVWIYRYMATLSDFQRGLFFVGCVFSAVSIFHILEKVHFRKAKRHPLAKKIKLDKNSNHIVKKLC